VKTERKLKGLVAKSKIEEKEILDNPELYVNLSCLKFDKVDQFKLPLNIPKLHPWAFSLPKIEKIEREIKVDDTTSPWCVRYWPNQSVIDSKLQMKL